jgi:ABC-type Fe3+/spermidine/putrescine transport system ATPase subunit
MLRVERLERLRGPAFSLYVDALEVRDGERVSVLGPSGSGKSTLLRLIAGLEQPTRGRILLDGKLVSGTEGVPPHLRGVSLLGQELGLWPHLTAAGHLAFARTGGRSIAASADDVRLLRLVGLGARTRARPNELSGGERQRLALARALARRPRLLLLDEPFSNVDPVLAAELTQLLDEIDEARISARVEVRHTFFGRSRGDQRCIVLVGGRVVQDASWQRLRDDPLDPWIGELTRLVA